VARIREQIASERALAQAHVARLAQYKGMQDELAELERLYRDRTQRKAGLEASEATRAPSVEVLQSATRPDRAFRPDYTRDATLALAGSLLGSLLVMGLVELFNRSERQPGVLIAQPISVHGLALERERAPALPKAEGVQALGEQKAPLLAANVLPALELRDDELEALWSAAAPRAQAAIGLLLSGLSAEEVAQLDAAQLDAGAEYVRVSGASAREIALPHAVAAAVQRATGACTRLYETGDTTAAREALDADLLCAAHDAGLADADAVTPEVLRHAYLLHLVRQGARMSDVTALAGRLAPAVISAYAGYAPAGPRVALDPAKAVFPLLARLPAA
jgi:integrase